ncbi:MAG: hypothetical protein J6Z05_09020, partial [Lachnospiraceae bacterium]|nr:hypothetical protein [Lachnospiraceae bacterium]
MRLRFFFNLRLTLRLFFFLLRFSLVFFCFRLLLNRLCFVFGFGIFFDLSQLFNTVIFTFFRVFFFIRLLFNIRFLLCGMVLFFFVCL